MDMSQIGYARPPGFAGHPHNVAVLSRRFPRELEARRPKLMEALSRLYEEQTGVSVDLTKIPVVRQRLLQGLAENLQAHHSAAVSGGMLGTLLNAGTDARRVLGLQETVTTADIATFTKQELAYVVDVFAGGDVDELVTVVNMLGPTAFVHRQIFRQEDASDHYGAGTALVDGLDPSYADCPAECEEANGIDVEITSETIEADCYRLAGTYCYPANYYMSAQYGKDLGAVLMEGMSIQHMRTRRADILQWLIANAGGTETWNMTPAVGSYYETADPLAWKRELFAAINAAGRDIRTDTDGRVVADILFGDVEGVGIFTDMSPLELVPGAPGDMFAGRLDVRSPYLGTTKVGRYKVYEFAEGMPTNTLGLIYKNDADPTAIVGEFVPLTMLQAWLDPSKAQVKLGSITLRGKAMIHPGRIREITIGA